VDIGGVSFRKEDEDGNSCIHFAQSYSQIEGFDYGKKMHMCLV
jgi:hypothetical protein